MAAAYRCARAASQLISASFPPAAPHSGTITLAASSLFGIFFLIGVFPTRLPLRLFRVAHNLSGIACIYNCTALHPRTSFRFIHMLDSSVPMAACHLHPQVSQHIYPPYVSHSILLPHARRAAALLHIFPHTLEALRLYPMLPSLIRQLVHRSPEASAPATGVGHWAAA
jgi:hypothetical protein